MFGENRKMYLNIAMDFIFSSRPQEENDFDVYLEGKDIEAFQVCEEFECLSYDEVLKEIDKHAHMIEEIHSSLPPYVEEKGEKND